VTQPAGSLRIHDISQPLGATTAVWPGDRQPEVEWTLRIDAGDSVNVAALMLSVHTGTHVDGSLHFDVAGAPAGALPLDAYIGRVLVVDARAGDVIGEDAIAGIDVAAEERILFRTRDDVDETRFPKAIKAISPALARRLADAGVRLVGTDAPSVDPLDSKTLDAHHALARGRVAILENAVLSAVPAGRYFLVALPLRLTEADSSPVRAVLLDGVSERPL
jgi:arylformamidase